MKKRIFLIALACGFTSLAAAQEGPYHLRSSSNKEFDALAGKAGQGQEAQSGAAATTAPLRQAGARNEMALPAPPEAKRLPLPKPTPKPKYPMPVNERVYPNLPPPVSGAYPPGGRPGFVMEKRETTSSVTYTAFPARAVEPTPLYPLDVRVIVPAATPAPLLPTATPRVSPADK